MASYAGELLDIFLCHGPCDAEKAAAVEARLRTSAGARVSIEECDSREGAIPFVWDQGLSSAAIVLLLSPGCVPKPLKLGDWNPLIEHALTGSRSPVISVLTAPCAYPKLLERRRFFAWEGAGSQALREIERIAQSLLPPPETASLELAPRPWFAGREEEMETLWRAVADQPGVALIRGGARSGKTALAQEFARRARRQFREIHWIRCGGASPAYLAGELSVSVGVPAGPDEESTLEAVRAELAGRRALLVLDSVGDSDVLFLPGGRVSAVVTSGEPLLLPDAVEIYLDGAYPAPAGVTLDDDAGALARSMTICDPHGCPAALAARIAGLEPAPAQSAMAALIAAGRVDPFDLGGEVFRFPSGTPARPLHRWHAEAVAEIFARWRQEPAPCDACAAEFERAYEWALDSDWVLAKALGRRGFAFFRWRGRAAEARRVIERLHAAAGDFQDREMLEECDWEMSWFAGARTGGPRGTGGEQLALDFG